MGTSEMLFVLIALVIFMSMTVVVNNMRTDHTENTINTQITNDAISLAQSILDEAWSKRFDEKTDLENLTYSSNLGKESGESYEEDEFDDIDDFVDYPSKVMFGVDELNVKVDVYYVKFDSSGDLIETTDRTQMKNFKVTITHDHFHCYVELEQVYSFLGAQ